MGGRRGRDRERERTFAHRIIISYMNINFVFAYSQVKGCGLVITRGGPQIVTSSIVQQLEGGGNEE